MESNDIGRNESPRGEVCYSVLKWILFFLFNSCGHVYSSW